VSNRYIVNVSVVIDDDAAPAALFKACADGDVSSFFREAADRTPQLSISVIEYDPDEEDEPS
jgi:hypothetical protein